MPRVSSPWAPSKAPYAFALATQLANPKDKELAAKLVGLEDATGAVFAKPR